MYEQPIIVFANINLWWKGCLEKHKSSAVNVHLFIFRYLKGIRQLANIALENLGIGGKTIN